MTARKIPLWLLGVVTLSGSLGMHVFVPALPLAGMELGADPRAMQWTIVAYIVGMAVGQPFYGPIADRWGRRPVLLAGLATFVVGGASAGLATGVHGLIAFRFVQALGGSAGLVLGRAIVRDSAIAGEAASKLALMNLSMTIGPGLAPLVGGAIATLLGWRAIFAVLTMVGLANLACVYALLPETRASRADKGPSVLLGYGHLLRSRPYLYYTIGGGCATSSLYAFISTAPLIFVHQLHKDPANLGFYLTTTALGLSAGALAANRISRRVAVHRLLGWATLVSLLGAGTFLASVLAGELGVAVTLSSIAVFTFGAGLASPSALAEALGVNPALAGSASGLYGGLQMASGAVFAALAGLGSNPALAAAMVLVGAVLASQLCFWRAERLQAQAPALA
ncbi:multidrug effflux MFS transporter [Novosphingobium sp. BL-52-GroH]|uniref:multidrug effflux MFS transporter n=1 Tax=Novosphingobium sp. BL-52-GroH TaxID=3349877 RepID=UPI00384FE6A0